MEFTFTRISVNANLLMLARKVWVLGTGFFTALQNREMALQDHSFQAVFHPLYAFNLA